MSQQDGRTLLAVMYGLVVCDMANEQNLVPIKRGADARTKGMAGGLASGKVRRKKASIKKAFMAIAAAPCQDKDTRAILQSAGLPESETNIAAALAFSMIQKAMDGNANMMRLCLQMLGEEPNLQLRERTQDWKERVLQRGGDEETNISVQILDDVRM